MKSNAGSAEIFIIKGDITEQSADAIVNAANSSLVLGGGVAGAIRLKGGPSIQQECDAIGGTAVGTAVLTGGGNLRSRHVIHAVGPRMGEGDEDRKLESATLSSLQLADRSSFRSIVFPAISTGIFGYPLERCAQIMLYATLDFLARKAENIEKVVFCLFDDQAYGTFVKTLENLSRQE